MATHEKQLKMKKQAQEQLLAVYLIEKSIAVVERYELDRSRETLTKLLSIAYNSLLAPYALSRKAIEDVLDQFELKNQLFFTEEIYFLPLSMEERFISIQFEISPIFLDQRYDLFFEYLFMIHVDLDPTIVLDVLFTLSEQYKKYLDQSGFIPSKLKLNEQGEKKIRSMSWEALHDDNFDLVFDVLSNPHDSTFADVLDSFFTILEELPTLPKEAKYFMYTLEETK